MAFETNLSAQPTASGQNPRIPRAHANSGRTQRLETPAAEGPPPLNPMIPPGGVEDPPAGGTAPQTFPKDSRLLRRGDFRRVYEEGQRRSGSLCAVFFRPNGLARTRLGITTPARLGKAVLRNRVKRRLREVFRLHRAALPAGWDIVLNPRGAVADVPFATLEREVMRLFPAQAPPPGESQK